ncbi:MAG: spore maturation protein [Erysipelotrichaceae bacterium]|nr:spore maturation protein [Erysipelotrichaceae bacterium]
MTNFIIPSIVSFILIYGIYKKIDIFDVFLEGVKEGLSMALKIFPTMFAMVISIDILVKSNIITDLTKLIAPILQMIHFPQELLSLAIMRPISGSSSLVLMNEILKIHGPDSYLGRIASVIQGSTDTTIYILSLYYSSIGIKKIKYSLIVGLLADLCAIILSVVVIQILF